MVGGVCLQGLVHTAQLAAQQLLKYTDVASRETDCVSVFVRVKLPCVCVLDFVLPCCVDANFLTAVRVREGEARDQSIVTELRDPIKLSVSVRIRFAP